MTQPSTASKPHSRDLPAVSDNPAQRLPIGQRFLAFDDTGGPGPLVIALPGMGDLRGEYRYLTPYLTGAGYRVVTVDVRGHGGSSPQWDDYSARAIGQDVLALMAHLGHGKAILIGNSFSAGSALWAAHEAPHKVTATVLIGPVLRDAKHIPWYLQALLAVGLGGPWRVSFWITYWTSLFPMRKPSDFKRYRDTLRNSLREPGRMNALKRMIALSKSDTEAMLTNTGMPGLVIMGTKDPDFPDATAEAEWAAGRLGAKLLLIQGAGHYPQAEVPEEVGPAIVRFLAGDRS